MQHEDTGGGKQRSDRIPLKKIALAAAQRVDHGGKDESPGEPGTGRDDGGQG